MTQQHSDDLHEKVRHCLLHDWDPIGIRDIPEAHNEYDSYVCEVCDLLTCGADAFKIRQHLAYHETVNMGLSVPSSDLDAVVKKLLDMVGG